MAIQVLIDGQDRTDFIHYQGRAGWNLMRGNRGTCTLPFIVEPGSTFMPIIGQYVEIFDGGQREWAGTFDDVRIGWLGDDGWHISTATGVTLDSRIDGVQINKAQVATLEGAEVSCGAAFTQMFTAAVDAGEITGITLGIVEDGPNIQALNVTSLKDAFDSISRMGGMIWYFDSRDLTVNLHAAGLRAADWVLSDQETSAEGGVLWESLQWQQSRADFADKQVIQLPPQSTPAQSSTFAGDGSTTNFTFPGGVYPQFVLSAKNSGTGTALGHAIEWVPGSNQVTVTPAMASGQSLVVKWIDESQVIVENQDYGSFVGHKARRYTRTRTFTEDGTLQEATAMLARYAMLPSQATLQTDKPGITIARKWQVSISSPAEAAGLMNGYWQVIEVEAEIVPGMEQLDAPFGHFRYTLHLVNFDATAIFEGDGSTTDFSLPQSGTVNGAQVWNAPTQEYEAIALPDQVHIDPAPPVGSTVVTQYTPGGEGSSAPDVQQFPDAWQQMFPDSGLEPLPFDGTTAPDVPIEADKTKICLRTLTLRDTTVGDDIAPHTAAYASGRSVRILAGLTIPIGSDLTVVIHFNGSGTDFEVTIPASSAIYDVIEIPLVTGSPPMAFSIIDQEVFSADITASSGEKNMLKGVAQITVQWEAV